MVLPTNHILSGFSKLLPVKRQKNLATRSYRYRCRVCSILLKGH
jgi:hypothetical protein